MKKVIAFVRWFFVIVPIGLLGLLTSWLLYPLWDLSHWKVFWLWGDNGKIKEDGSFAEDYRIYLKGEETFWKKYKWHVFRNRTRNLIDLVKPAQGIEVIEEVVTYNLFRNYHALVPGGEFAGLKYVAKKGEDPWQVNSGDVIDFKYSIIGKSFIYYSIGKKLYFRFSYCDIHFNRWFTIKAGTNKDRFVLTFKIQK